MDTPTLRDQFAMSALTGLLANETDFDNEYKQIKIPETAYWYADALMAEREKWKKDRLPRCKNDTPHVGCAGSCFMS